jgi:hypothetical protein
MIPRGGLALVVEAIHRQAAVALIGPRQVGKTTLALFATLPRAPLDALG